MATIVVIDDDPVILDLLRAVIAEGGHTVIPAPGLGAVPAGGRAHLVIADLVPLKAYRRDAALTWIATLRERFPATPLLIVTAHAGAAAEPDQLGAEGVVRKPFDVDALVGTMNELLGRGAAVPPTS